MDAPTSNSRARITSDEGIERAKKALLRKGHDSILGFSKQSSVSRNTITKFFDQKPIQVDIFRQICAELELEDWQSVVQSSIPGTNSPSEPVPASKPVCNSAPENVTQQITISDLVTNQIQSEIVLEGDSASISENLKTILEVALKQQGGSSLRIKSMRPGSIRIAVEGTPNDIRRLVQLIKAGYLKELGGKPIQEVQLSQESLSIIDQSKDEKWSLIKRIQDIDSLYFIDFSGTELSDANFKGIDFAKVGALGAAAPFGRPKLRDADLSGADLEEARLIDADLTNANLSNANLRSAKLGRAKLEGANLSGSDLTYAILRKANLRGADLRGANLSNADLRGASLQGAIFNATDLTDTAVGSARFSESLDIPKSLQQDLISTGKPPALLGDSPSLTVPGVGV